MLPELIGHRHDDVGKREVVLQISALLGVPGDVDIEAGAGTLAHPVGAGRGAAGEEGPAVVAVQRDVEDALRGVEHVLDAVAVVHVPVQDEDALEAVHGDRVLRGNAHVVEQTESHRAVLPREEVRKNRT